MTRYINRYIFILIVTALSACKVSKDIGVPATAVPDNFRTAQKADSTSVADIQWNAFFKEADLQKLIDSAIVKNYDMQTALKNIEQAQLLFKQTKWGNWPIAQLQVGANSSRPSDNSLNGLSAQSFLGTSHIEDFTVGVGLSWEADIWGKVRNQKRKALVEYLQTEEARKAIQTNIVANVSQGFYNLLMLDAQLVIAKRNLELNDSTLRIVRLQYNAGQVTSLGVQQTEAQQLAVAQIIPQLEQSIGIQENALSVLTGETPKAIARSIVLNQINVAADLPVGVPAAMVSRRPDVKSSELALTTANAKVGLAKANMYPSLTITANGGINSFKISNWFNIPASLFGMVAGSLTQPLFQHKQLKTKYETELLEREKTVIAFRQSVLNAVGEVSDALVKIDKLQAQQAIAVKRVNTLQEATSNASMLFKNGLANYLEVITAQRNVLESELALASIKRDQLSASVELYRSLGGGWK
ncbi:efflux transporter outer membrane subunit [Chitinophagaceae bacterium LWZ2-11]